MSTKAFYAFYMNKRVILVPTFSMQTDLYQ